MSLDISLVRLQVPSIYSHEFSLVSLVPAFYFIHLSFASVIWCVVLSARELLFIPFQCVQLCREWEREKENEKAFARAIHTVNSSPMTAIQNKMPIFILPVVSLPGSENIKFNIGKRPKTNMNRTKQEPHTHTHIVELSERKNKFEYKYLCVIAECCVFDFEYCKTMHCKLQQLTILWQWWWPTCVYVGRSPFFFFSISLSYLFFFFLCPLCLCLSFRSLSFSLLLQQRELFCSIFKHIRLLASSITINIVLSWQRKKHAMLLLEPYRNLTELLDWIASIIISVNRWNN